MLFMMRSYRTVLPSVILALSMGLGSAAAQTASKGERNYSPVFISGL